MTLVLNEKCVNMHRFLPGILLIQIICVVILWINILPQVELNIELALKIAIPLVLLAISTAFWFDAIAKNRAAHLITRLKDQHAREREKLQVKTEREKTRVLKDAHKEIQREQRRVNNKANRKVGVAFFAAAGAGVVMLITELITFGMMTLMTAGGALSGYFYRGRKDNLFYDPEYDVQPEKSPRVINPELPAPSESKPVKRSPIRSSDRY